MANLDSRSKRASSVGLLTPPILSLVKPDGTLSQGDRQHTAFSYSGILATAAATPTGDATSHWVKSQVVSTHWLPTAQPTSSWSFSLVRELLAPRSPACSSA